MATASVWEVILPSAVVGAAVSALIHFASSWLDRREAREGELRADRKRVYLELIAFAREAPLQVAEWATVGHDSPRSPAEDLHHHIGMIDALGSREALAAALRLQDAFVTFAEQLKERSRAMQRLAGPPTMEHYLRMQTSAIHIANETWFPAVDRFVRVARRELLITD